MPKFGVDDFLTAAHAPKERQDGKARNNVITASKDLPSHRKSPPPPARPPSPLFDGINEEGFNSEQFPSFYPEDGGNQSDPPHCYIHCRRSVCRLLVANAQTENLPEKNVLYLKCTCDCTKTDTEPVLSSPRLPDRLDSDLVQSMIDATANTVSSEAFDIRSSDLQSIVKLVRAYAEENSTTGSSTIRKLATAIKLTSGFSAMAFALTAFFDCMSQYFSWSMEHVDGSGRLEFRTVTRQKLMEEIELPLESYLLDYMVKHGQSYLRLVKDITTIPPFLITRRFKDTGAIKQVWDFWQCMGTITVKILQWRHLQLQAAQQNKDLP